MWSGRLQVLERRVLNSNMNNSDDDLVENMSYLVLKIISATRRQDYLYYNLYYGIGQVFRIRYSLGFTSENLMSKTFLAMYFSFTSKGYVIKLEY